MKSSAVSATLLKAKSLYEAGRLHWSLGEFPKSIQKLKEASELYLEVQEFDPYFRAQALMIRMHYEMANKKAITEACDSIERLLKKESLPTPPQVLVTYAFLAQESGDLIKALDHLQKSLAAALSAENLFQIRVLD